MIEKLIGEDMKILSMKYSDIFFGFEVECIRPGYNDTPCIYPFDKLHFPNHLPIPLLDEKVQIGEHVHIWLKEEELLKKEGWKELAENSLSSPDSPFKIGKGKKVYLGGAHKGIVCLDAKFNPFIAIQNYRFSPAEIKCVLRLDNLVQGKNAEIVIPSGSKYIYSADKQTISTPGGYTFKKDEIESIIDLLRRASLV